MQGSQGPRFVGHAINCLCVVIQMKYFCDRNFPWPPAAARSATTASKPGLSPGIYTGGVACVVHGPEAHGAGTRRARVRLRPGPHKSGPANTFGVRMLRVGGWDGTAGKRSRGCQRVHARHGQEYATEAGVAWQGQGMLAIWRGGQHVGRAGDLFTCGRGRSGGRSNSPSSS